MRLRATRLTAIASAARHVFQFSPASLFASGEQGAWYDPSDFSTLFQGSAGTLPITAVEQPVGLMLDKSKGLVLGPELVTNGDFSAGTTGWTAVDGSTPIAVAGGEASISPGAYAQQAGRTFSSGKSYKITFSVRGSGSNIQPRIYIATGPYLAGAQDVYTYTTATYTGGVQLSAVFTPADAKTVLVFKEQFGGSGTMFIDNISVCELPGAHAFQSTATSRPVLSARVNLLTKTEQFDDAAWIKLGVSATSNSLTATTSGNYRYTYQTGPSTNATYTYKVKTKSGTSNWCYLLITDGNTADITVYFDVANGVVGANTKIGTGYDVVEPPTISDFDDDGYRTCTVVVLSTKGAALRACVGVCDNNNSVAVTAGKSIELGVADLRVANDGVGLPAYQRVNTSTDYDTTGFPMYLRFDGVDDFLVTNSINFTSTDKMTVWAGVRKLSDAARGMVVELSATLASNNGTFFLSAPDATTTANYVYYSRGSALTGVTGATYTAPITNVVTGFSSISDDSVILRVNGTQVAPSTADQGTGNYGNYPLYIGRRGGTTLPFNGRIYSLIVRGAQSTTAQIEATEKYVNDKTRSFDYREITDTASFRWNSATASPDAE